MCGASFSRHASWESNSWAWPSRSKTRHFSWRHIGHWEAPYAIWVSSAAAQAHLAQGLTLYDAQRHHSHMFLYSMEPGVVGLSYAAWVLWHLGYPDQALQKSKAARTLAQELSHPFSLAAARVFAAMFHQLRRERALTQEWAEAAHHPRARARISTVVRARDGPAGLGARRTGPE